MSDRWQSPVPRVQVRWRDATHDHGSGFVSLKAARESKLPEIITLGFLVADGPDNVVVAQAMNEDHDVQDFLTVAKAWVEEIVVLSEAKD